MARSKIFAGESSRTWIAGNGESPDAIERPAFRFASVPSCQGCRRLPRTQPCEITTKRAIELVQGGITHQRVDSIVIVIAANPELSPTARRLRRSSSRCHEWPPNRNCEASLDASFLASVWSCMACVRVQSHSALRGRPC